MKSYIMRFHHDECGESQSDSTVVVAVIVLIAVALLGPSFSGAANWIASNRGLIIHGIVALGIMFGGAYIGAKNSKSFSQSWGWAEVSMLAAIAYLVVFVGLPMATQAFESRMNELFNGFTP